ncbi:hypothetical protein FRB99_000694 [Tulasnella sp. 403]|nr:hypothetical protein FRB99_000694 [Tulasnella sp. 403]
MVTPTYYVIFTFCTLVTSVILYQGLKSTATQIITVVLGFLVICMSSFPPLPLPPQLIRSAGSGIILLQMSKIDPEKLQKEHNLDRRSTLLLKVAQEEVKKPDGDAQDITKDEEPGLDCFVL